MLFYLPDWQLRLIHAIQHCNQQNHRVVSANDPEYIDKRMFVGNRRIRKVIYRWIRRIFGRSTYIVVEHRTTIDYRCRILKEKWDDGAVQHENLLTTFLLFPHCCWSFDEEVVLTDDTFMNESAISSTELTDCWVLEIPDCDCRQEIEWKRFECEDLSHLRR